MVASYSKNSRESATRRAFSGLAVTAVLATLLAALPWRAAPGADSGVREALRLESGRLSAPAGGGPYGPGTAIGAPRLVAAFYEARDFAPAWLTPGRAAALLRVIHASDRDGLRPADYRPRHIERLLTAAAAAPPGRAAAAAPDAGDLAGRDILLTDALARLAAHLRYGKANPDSPLATATLAAEGASAPQDPTGLVAALLTIAESESLAEAIGALRPNSAHYRRLRAALAEYRRLAVAGGWPTVSDGPTIRPGERDVRVRELARRLAASGDLVAGRRAGPPPEAEEYGERLQAAVRRFQARHGLATDGIVGPATLRALNVPVAARIDGLRVNLERARWDADRPADDYLLVNIAAFRADLVRGNETVWQTRVVVGEPDQQTPEVCSMLKYVVFNPTWTVPHRIASEEMLPRIRRDPRFFARGGYELYDRDGRIVDPSAVDWASVSEDSFDLTIVQRPGPANELGQVKFVFPNEYSVTMHDTPARHLFGAAQRAFSHGCVRVDEPLALAEQVLTADGWTRTTIDAQVLSDETRTVFLSEPLPVFLRYRTAEVDDAGIVHFFDDIYERDAAVLAALDE